jgi:TfoX/Sxy family transcriptional regulator of competence genes
MSKVAPRAPADKVALYDKLVASVPRVERKGAGFPYTAVNGNMFSLLRPDGVLCLRLAEKERAAFVASYKTEPVIMYGALMKEYVAVPDALLANFPKMKRYFAASVAYAETLKPKPTKRAPKR